MNRKLLFTILLLNIITVKAQEPVFIKIGKPSSQAISRNIYGQFAEHLGRGIYDGVFRNGKIRMDIVEALRKIKVPNLRWPGGCFADNYNWRDGIGLTSKRPSRVSPIWGMVTDTNGFGTTEFLQLCELLHCEPYIAGNVGTGTPRQMSDWLEYLNFDGNSSLAAERGTNGHPQPYHVSWWGVGNESWGCGGNMTPEYYAGLYKQFASFCEDYPGTEPLKKIATGPSSDDTAWTAGVMKNIPADMMWGLSLHYYTMLNGGWPPKGSATTFSESEYFHMLKQSLRMDSMINMHLAVMDRIDTTKSVALVVDEWGIWTQAEPGTNRKFLFQQNSLRDALIAATTLNIFNNHCDRVKGANLAQMVNVLQSIILTSGDTMVLTPTYHVFDLYKVHQDAKWLPLQFESPYYEYNKEKIPAINASASIDSSGLVHISLVNLNPANSITIIIRNMSMKGKKISGQLLTSSDYTDCNSFKNPTKVQIENFSGYRVNDTGLTVTLPSKSVTVLTLK